MSKVKGCGLHSTGEDNTYRFIRGIEQSARLSDTFVRCAIVLPYTWFASWPAVGGIFGEVTAKKGRLQHMNNPRNKERCSEASCTKCEFGKQHVP